jgi:hypothetical protein
MVLRFSIVIFTARPHGWLPCPTDLNLFAVDARHPTQGVFFYFAVCASMEGLKSALKLGLAPNVFIR